MIGLHSYAAAHNFNALAETLCVIVDDGVCFRDTRLRGKRHEKERNKEIKATRDFETRKFFWMHNESRLDAQ